MHHSYQERHCVDMGRERAQHIQEVKGFLMVDSQLIHYDVNLPFLLECDALPWNVGAELSHHFPDGAEQPIAYASRCLAAAAKNYSQLDCRWSGSDIWGEAFSSLP